ncbi:MAG: sel1 repeat family protein [Devosia sp.]|uniref:SEL1-like repeat protein n=1 Tax=Devosia sp. TaxID=1871048 RepID=UPI001AD33BF5|nr:tetratricopeptide repeat protein [Devosia sp.]MBN9317517.1 sel1 repeat family protein [Devosia sp.]
MWLRFGVLGAGLFALAAPALATETFDACAAAAASQYEAGYEAIGLNSDAMDAAHAIAVCTTALAASPDAAPLQAWLGRAYATTGDAATAATYLEPSAVAGNALAQTLLGDMLIVGDGVPQDMVRGADLLKLAADAGFAPAEDSLGLSYDYAEGVEQNQVEAARLYRRAAEKGVARAMANLGSMYAEGLGLDRDIVAAAAWYQRAADKGDPRAQFNLGELYETGALGEVDHERAATLFRAAAGQGNAMAANALGHLTQHGSVTTPDPAAALALYRQAADQGLAQAQLNLGLLYEDGIGVPRDLALARQYYRQASESGNSDASARLGLVYLRSGEADYGKAVQFTQRAADAGNPVGLDTLGHLFEHGYGVARNPDKALDSYHQAADLGYRPAADNLARLEATLSAPLDGAGVRTYPRSKIAN